DEEYHEEVIARSRSYTRQNLPESNIVDTYINPKTKECYALARLKRNIVVDLMEEPIRETQRDVLNHLRRGSERQAQGQLIDALTEFGGGWQKALTLPRKFNWLSDEKTERYSEHLEKLLDGLVKGTSLRVMSELSEEQKLTFRCVNLVGALQIPLKQLPLTAEYIEGGGQLRSPSGQEGSSVNIITDDNGQAEVFIQERGKSIHKNRIRVSLDEASINPLYSLIGQDRVSALLAKEVIVSLDERQTYRVAVLPFENLRQETEMDWIAQYLQNVLTDTLAQAKSIVVLARIDLPAILKELDLQMSDLIDPGAAMRIGSMQDATHVVTGTYTAIERHLQVSARLVDVEQGTVELVAEEKGDVIKSQSQPNSDFFELAGKLAFSLAAQLDPDLAKTEFSQSIAIPSVPPADPVVEIFRRALRLQNKDRIDEAIKLYLEGLKIDANRAEAYNNLGICYGKKKLIKEAREAYETAIRLKPRFPEVYNNLGWLLLETGDPERAIEQFQKGLELAPKTLHIWINLAWAYHVKGDYKKAIETNEAILKEHPLALYPRYNMALAYLCKGDIAAAEQEYKAAYNQTSRPDEPAYRSAVNDLQNLLTNGIRPREAQRMLELLRWRK
ncbi:MAG: FlgO family outer membrane protein, partial [Candidatus Poribacteria bacterium]